MGEQGLARSTSGRAAEAGALAVVLLLALATYHRAIETGFAQDDFTYLSRAAGLDHAGASFRPISTGLAFRVLYLAFGLDPGPWHVTSLLLHLVNVTGVFVLARVLLGSLGAAAIAATLFGVSAIGFTPLHWSSGIAELLATALLLAATLLQLRSTTRGGTWDWAGWAAAGVALLAMLAKETAAAWVLVVVALEWQRTGSRLQIRALVPALLATGVFGAFVLGTRVVATTSATDAYAWSLAPSALLLGLLTYARWSIEFWNPIRDVQAVPDPGAWRLAMPLLIAAGAVYSAAAAKTRERIAFGLAWWLAFVLPVLPLLHHAYLYYLYIPSIGGALALAALAAGWLERRPVAWARLGAMAAVAAIVVVEMRSVRVRETATRDALPIDRTIRDAMLLEHSLPTLRAAGLPKGTRVLFVSPILRERFDLTTGAPTLPEDTSGRATYLPLEAALRGGETLRLMVPDVVYAGFARTIPDSLEDAECFYFDQRGRLERWGRGTAARARQASVIAAAGGGAGRRE